MIVFIAVIYEELIHFKLLQFEYFIYDPEKNFINNLECGIEWINNYYEKELEKPFEFVISKMDTKNEKCLINILKNLFKNFDFSNVNCIILFFALFIKIQQHYSIKDNFRYYFDAQMVVKNFIVPIEHDELLNFSCNFDDYFERLNFY